MHFDIANLVLNIGQSNPKDWVDVFSALLTPTVAIFAGIIAYQQWQTQEKQRKQDLFEMRYDNLFKVILENTNRYDMYKKEKFENLNFEEKQKLDDEFRLKLHKYKFLITKEDFEKLITLYNNICSSLIKEEQTMKEQNKIDIMNTLNKMKNFFDEMEEILDKYLRIEQEPIFYKLKRFFNMHKNFNKKSENNDAI